MFFWPGSSCAQDSLCRHLRSRTEFCGRIDEFWPAPGLGTEVDDWEGLGIGGPGTEGPGDAKFSVCWVVGVRLGHVVEWQFARGTVEHVSIGGGHTLAVFRWEVEIEGWSIPSGGVDYLTDHFHGIVECGQDVGCEFLVGGWGETLEQEGLGLAPSW